MEMLGQWDGVLQNGISSIAFSPDGSKICACGADVNHNVAVLDVKGRIKKGKKGKRGFVLGKAKGGPAKILDCVWSDNGHFITCGPKNYAFWVYDKKKKFKKGKGGIKRPYNDRLNCCCYNDGIK